MSDEFNSLAWRDKRLDLSIVEARTADANYKNLRRSVREACTHLEIGQDIQSPSAGEMRRICLVCGIAKIVYEHELQHDAAFGVRLVLILHTREFNAVVESFRLPREEEGKLT